MAEGVDYSVEKKSMAGWARITPPRSILASLAHVQQQAMDPDVPYVKILRVFVYGKTAYKNLQSTIDQPLMLSNTNIYTTQGDLYVLNRSIPPEQKYGPFDMNDVWCMPRIPNQVIHQIMSRLDSRYFNLDQLDEKMWWKLDDLPLPEMEADPPTCVIESARFVRDNFAPEMEDCAGVIILPTGIQHRGWKHDRIRHIRRDAFNITLIQLIDDGAWFLLQTCRTLHYESPDSPAWYMLYKEKLSELQ